jgi:hypothetical protein
MVSCKRCGQEGHPTWQCRQPEKAADKPSKSYGRSPAVDALETVKAVSKLPPETRAKAAAAVVTAKMAMLAPPGECPHCDARRAYNAERVRLHRAKKPT